MTSVQVVLTGNTEVVQFSSPTCKAGIWLQDENITVHLANDGIAEARRLARLLEEAARALEVSLAVPA